jgi:dimeric dUTPase (all-alpha-NTP-PPase superfamily)
MTPADAQIDRLAAKTETMLRLQDEMNSRVDADWRLREREWYRAIWIECAELMDHYGGWKWWKHSGSPAPEQALLEIVDIWHFGLSLRLNGADTPALAARRIAQEWLQPAPSRGFLGDVETLAAAAVDRREFAVSIVPTLLGALGSGFEDLYRAYVGKNVLNMFRQDHGYRDGRYQKTWLGREDNEHLSEIVASLDPDQDEYRAAIYAALRRRYPGAASRA